MLVGSIFIIGSVLNIIGVYINYMGTNAFLKQKDKRVSLTKSVLSNIRFIKSKARELYYHYRISAIRRIEMKYLRFLFYIEAMILTIPFVLGAYTPILLWVIAIDFSESGLHSENLNTIDSHFGTLVGKIQ